MGSIQKIFEATEECSEIPKDHLDAMAGDLVLHIQDPLSLDWLCKNIARFDIVSLGVIEMAAVRTQLPKPLMAAIQNAIGLAKDRWVIVSYNTILAFQGDRPALEALGQILLSDLTNGSKQYSHTVLAASIAVVHNDRAMEILISYSQLTQEQECREFVENLINNWVSLTPTGLGW